MLLLNLAKIILINNLKYFLVCGIGSHSGYLASKNIKSHLPDKLLAFSTFSVTSFQVKFVSKEFIILPGR